MNTDSLLHRQVHPSFVQAGKVSSQAFRPTPKDSQQLSVYDGDLISAEQAWEHFTSVLSLPSVGVMAVSNSECHDLDLLVRSQPLIDFPEHAVIDFSGFVEGEIRRKAKRLRSIAEVRGWLFRNND